MKRKETMTIIGKKFIAKDTVELILQNDYISQRVKPGQFIHILIDGFTLRRPISIADVDLSRKTVTILFKTVGEGTQKLASYNSGDMLDVLGPLGNGFSLPSKNVKTVLLIGGGIGVPPLHLLGKRFVEKGVRVISILGFQEAGSVFYEKQFQVLGDTFIVTDDGSYGYQGVVTDLLSKVGSFDTYYACGPTPMLKAIQQHLGNTKGYISLEERMGCGVGACFACVIPTTDGLSYKKICQDGPVFNAKEVSV